MDLYTIFNGFDTFLWRDGPSYCLIFFHIVKGLEPEKVPLICLFSSKWASLFKWVILIFENQIDTLLCCKASSVMRVYTVFGVIRLQIYMLYNNFSFTCNYASKIIKKKQEVNQDIFLRYKWLKVWISPTCKLMRINDIWVHRRINYKK